MSERPPQLPPYTIEVRAGRLIEARVFALRSREDADAYSQALGLQVLKLANVSPILCADHRPVVIYTQEVADRLTELFLQMNSRLERVAILVARSNATLGMQLARIVREAANLGRKLCFDSLEAQAHLAPIFDPSELARMREFLDEWSPTRSSRPPPGSLPPLSR